MASRARRRSRNSSAVSPSRKAAPCHSCDASSPVSLPPTTRAGRHRTITKLRLHFHNEFPTRIDAGRLVETIAGMAADLREEYVVTATSSLTAQVQVAGWQVPRGRRRQPPAPAERREPASPRPPQHRPSWWGGGDAYLRRGARGGEPGRRVRSRAGYGQDDVAGDVPGQVASGQPHGLVLPGGVEAELVGEVGACGEAALAGGDHVDGGEV